MTNKTGIYFAFWERNWSADYCAYIEKTKRLGFDTLELGAGALADMTQSELKRIADTAKSAEMDLTYCIGLPAQYNVASPDEAVRKRGVAYLQALLRRIAFMGGDMLGGILYAAWPDRISSQSEREAAREKSLQSMRVLAETAENLGITLCLEIVNRFEQFIMNTASEGAAYLKDLERCCQSAGAVRLLLDTFHMNIEEDDLYAAIRYAGEKGLIGHFHIGECNRKAPGEGSGRMPWNEIIRALGDCKYSGRIVMEPFIKPGGEVGRDIRLYRDLSGGCTEEEMDQKAANACAFIKNLLYRYENPVRD